MTQANTQPVDVAERVPPYDLDAERAVLGAILLDSASLVGIRRILPDPAPFWSRTYRYFYAGLTLAQSVGAPIDLVSFRDLLARPNVAKTLCDAAGGPPGSLDLDGQCDELVIIAESVPSTANAEYYARIVRECYLLRQGATLCGQVIGACYNHELDPTESVDAMLAGYARQIEELSDYGRALPAVAVAGIVRRIVEAEDGGVVERLGTGLSPLDAYGFPVGEMTVCAARPSMGKSSLANNVVTHQAQCGVACLVFSHEMSAESWTTNMLASLANVPGWRLRTGNLRDTDRVQLKLVVDRPWMKDIHLVGWQANIEELIDSAHHAIRKHNVRFIVVDYIQLLRTKARHRSRETEVAEISHKLKELALTQGVAVFVLSQLNRDCERRCPREPRPALADLRDSGSIEQDADLVWLLYRPGHYSRDQDDLSCEVIVAKNRNGPTGRVLLYFRGPYFRFSDRPEEYGDPESDQGELPF